MPRPRHEHTGPPTGPPSGRAPNPGSGSVPPADVSGGTTRFLSAAVHLDSRLAESFIEEFLVERTRSIPRSPGVDAAAVLGDAAASHRRRQIRDVVLLLLAAVVALTYLGTAVLWLAVALALMFFGRTRPAGNGSSTRTVLLLVVGVVGVVLVSVVGVASLLFGALLTSVGGQFGTSSTAATGTAVTAVTVIGALALLAIPCVILTDELLVVALIRAHFTRQRFRHEPDAGEAGLVASLRRLGRDRFSSALARTSRADQAATGEADVVVFRGDDPFVGAGACIDRNTVVIPLEREDEADRRPPYVSEEALHDAVGQAVDAMRRRSSLAPHGRLEQLGRHEQILVSAYDLLMHFPSAEAQTYLPHGLDHAPVARIPLPVARQGRSAPREWARYYQCFRVEGWERDLTVSCYFTLGTDGHLLYLEWATCALAPLDPSYRVIDDHDALRRQALNRALSRIVSFPVSVPERLRRVFRSFAPPVAAPGHVAPDRYGAAVSLRELAAGPLDGYFHTADVLRYSSLFDHAVLDAVRAYLKAQGLRVADLEKAAGDVYNQTNINSTFAVGRGAQNHGTVDARSGGAAKETR